MGMFSRRDFFVAATACLTVWWQAGTSGMASTTAGVVLTPDDRSAFTDGIREKLSGDGIAYRERAIKLFFGDEAPKDGVIRKPPRGSLPSHRSSMAVEAGRQRIVSEDQRSQDQRRTSTVLSVTDEGRVRRYSAIQTFSPTTEDPLERDTLETLAKRRAALEKAKTAARLELQALINNPERQRNMVQWRIFVEPVLKAERELEGFDQVNKRVQPGTELANRRALLKAAVDEANQKFAPFESVEREFKESQKALESAIDNGFRFAEQAIERAQKVRERYGFVEGVSLTQLGIAERHLVSGGLHFVPAPGDRWFDKSKLEARQREAIEEKSLSEFKELFPEASGRMSFSAKRSTYFDRAVEAYVSRMHFESLVDAEVLRLKGTSIAKSPNGGNEGFLRELAVGALREKSDLPRLSKEEHDKRVHKKKAELAANSNGVPLSARKAFALEIATFQYQDEKRFEVALDYHVNTTDVQRTFLYEAVSLFSTQLPIQEGEIRRGSVAMRSGSILDFLHQSGIMAELRREEALREREGGSGEARSRGGSMEATNPEFRASGTSSTDTPKGGLGEGYATIGDALAPHPPIELLGDRPATVPGRRFLGGGLRRSLGWLGGSCIGCIDVEATERSLRQQQMIKKQEHDGPNPR